MKSFPVLVFLATSFSGARAQVSYDCVPGMPCWPTPTEWQEFNRTISGRLVRTIPWAAPCYRSSPYFDQAACSAVAAAYKNDTGRAGVYGATVWTQGEVCGSSQCLLQSLAPGLPPLFQTCELGRLSAYHVDAREVLDVSLTLAFVRQHNLRLSIKNAGHEFLGRSSTPNSLALWVRNMQTMRYIPALALNGCPSVEVPNVGEMGAGVQAGEAYAFFESVNMTVVGSNVASVGIAGGYGQAGGHGVYGPTFGLMVDQAVEFDVVTADGQPRTINECTDPDLFWAIRGGGAGTYAVLTAYRFRLQPMDPISLHHFRATFTLPGTSFTNSPIVRELVTAHVANQTMWSENSVAGHHYYGINFVEFFTSLPYNDNGARLQSLTATWLAGIRAIPGLTIELDEYSSHDIPRDYFSILQEAADRLETVGFGSTISSRLIPGSLFSPEPAPPLVNAVLEGLDINFGSTTGFFSGVPIMVLHMTTPVHTPDAENSTSAHPAWRTALWEVIYIGGWTKGFPYALQQDIIRTVNGAAEPVRRLTPGGGSYMYEDSVLVEDWQSTFFGEYYDRLLAIKDQYDPTHLFDCYKCVGWRGPTDRAYSCYGPNPSGPTIPD